jgi:cytochrome c-type biogenesis protein CcmH/NrfF
MDRFGTDPDPPAIFISCGLWFFPLSLYIFLGVFTVTAERDPS